MKKNSTFQEERSSGGISAPLGTPTSSSALKAQGADEDVGVPRGELSENLKNL